MPDDAFTKRRRKRELERGHKRNMRSMTRRMSEEARLTHVATRQAERAAAGGSKYVYSDSFMGPLPSGAQRASTVGKAVAAKKLAARRRNKKKGNR